IDIQTMVVSYNDNIVIAGETLAVVREKIMPAAVRKTSAVHIDHDWAFMGGIDFRCPKIDTQTVLTGHRGKRTAMQNECIFIGVSQVFPVSIKVRRILA